MKRLVVVTVMIASGVALFRFIHLETLAAALLGLPSDVLLSLLCLLTIAELVKGLRWAFFLRASQLDIRTIDGLTSYLAAQAATALPGGSFLSVRLIKEHGRVQMHQAAAGLLGQGIADMLALSLVSTAAIVATGARLEQIGLSVVVLAAAATGIAVFRSQGVARGLMRFLSHWRLTRRFACLEEDFRQHTTVLMNWRVLATGAVFSVAATLIAAAVLLTMVNALTERGISPGEAIYVHAFSGVTGTAIPIPGMVGVSDASQAGLLNYIGIGLARATFIALAYRTAGILYRTAIGSLVLLARYPHVLFGQVRVPFRRRVPVHVHVPHVSVPSAVPQAAQAAVALVEPLASTLTGQSEVINS